MAKAKKQPKSVPARRADRVRLTAEESLKRMQDFPNRKEEFIASVRKGKNRGLSA